MKHNNANYDEVKVITSNNVDLLYAAEVLESRIIQAEEEGYKRFGAMTPIYNMKTREFIFIQVMTK